MTEKNPPNSISKAPWDTVNYSVQISRVEVDSWERQEEKMIDPVSKLGVVDDHFS